MSESMTDRPNILFILLDDLGKGWVDTYGAEGIELPNVSALAEGGMQFTNGASATASFAINVTSSSLTRTVGQRSSWT